MKHTLKRYLILLSCLTLVQALQADSCSKCPSECRNCSSKPSYIPRSQSFNTARGLVGWQEHINKFGMDDLYGSFNATFEYTRSFRAHHIAEYFFGCDLKETNCPVTCKTDNKVLGISGSAVQNRQDCDWLADYFCLPRNYQSELAFAPRITNFVIDFDWFMGFDRFKEGLYLRIHAPLIYTRWNINMHERIINRGSLTHPSGYLASGTIARDKTPGTPSSETAANKDALLGSMTDYLRGGCSGSLCGDVQEQLQVCKISNQTCREVKFSEINIALGYNFLLEQDYHAGLNARLSIPTGTRPNGEYLFEPIAGNGHFWELGAGFSGHYMTWYSEDEERSCGLYLEGAVTHLFKDTQKRCLDLCGKPNSRYMLIAELGTPSSASDELLIGNAIASSQYTGNLFPLANKAVFEADVSYKVQGDLALKLSYTTPCSTFDIGYKVWGRTGQRCEIDESCTSFPSNTYVLKGDAQIYGFGSDGTNAVNPVKLSFSQQNATINNGQKNSTRATNFNTTQTLRNINVDSPAIATTNNTALSADTSLLAPRNGEAGSVSVGLDATNNNVVAVQGPVNGSTKPVFISFADFNAEDGPSALSHTIFVHHNHTLYSYNNNWTPYIGVGGEIEFAHKRSGVRSTPTQWGVWVKAGVAFE